MAEFSLTKGCMVRLLQSRTAAYRHASLLVCLLVLQPVLIAARVHGASCCQAR